MSFSPSPQQSAIFTSLQTPSGPNLCISAVAGSGKTTTIVESLTRIPRDPHALVQPSILFLAFNKANADTLATRVPRGVQCSTFHSLGLRALKSSGLVRRDVKIDGRKTSRLIYNAVGRDSQDVKSIERLVSLAKSVPTVSGDHQRSDHQRSAFWTSLITRHDLSFDDPGLAVRVAAKVLSDSSADLSCLDFDDMLYLPVMHNAAFDQQDWIFVDEAQDTNDIQLEVLSRLVKPTSRLIAVGDPYQAIYGFRGANSDAMSKLSSRFSCVSLPLSVSYRCPQAIVEEARKCLETNISE